MKIVFSKQALMEKLVPTMSTVSGKNTITSIEGILIETVGENTVRLSSYDMNKGIRTVTEAVSVIEEGSYIINAQRLFQIVKLLGDDEIELEVNEKLGVTITSGESSFSLFALSGSDFPNLPELTGDKGFSVGTGVLKKMIGKVLHSVAEQDNRQMLCGAYFVIDKDNIEIVSCDGYTLSRCTVKSEIEDIGRIASDKYSFIIPGHALSELIRILPDKDDEAAQVYLSRKHAIIEMDGITFFTRMIDSEYIDYHRIMPKEQTVFVNVSRDRFLEGLERANLVADEKIQGSGKNHVKISISENKLSLSSNSVNGNVFDTMECSHEGDDIVIGFNCRFLINSVRALECDTLHITLKSPNQSITIEPSTDEESDIHCFYMILPVRMTE